MSGFIVEKSFLRYDYYFESWKIGILRFNIFFSVEYFFFFLGRVERCIRVRSIRCNFKIFDRRKKKLSAEDDEDKCLDRNFLKIKLRRKMKVS